MNIHDWSYKKQKKPKKQKISMVTCYDYTSAKILANTSIDCILVGDSIAMTVYGYPNTLAATLEMMEHHTQAVAKGAPEKFIVSDLPFLSYRKNLNANVDAAGKLMRAGAHAVKLEGAVGNLKLIRHLSDSGIPVMGHLGLTPQFIHQLGGFTLQAKTTKAAKQLFFDAESLQEAGVFALVLECIPSVLAQELTAALLIPTIGIGAGKDTDGQVLVLQDLLGLTVDFKPKFVQQFMQGAAEIQQAIEAYINAINTGTYPDHEHCYDYPKVV